ncbi:UNVERIFIED_CONTAM: hypothetical protein Slati_4330400 [Sesamum latifolium]|uniref:Uncharacterized protein n=1 Tax=Sesamum latifolium TaxID=2727402 RepID=A0AAW2SN01_9LAMI
MAIFFERFDVSLDQLRKKEEESGGGMMKVDDDDEETGFRWFLGFGELIWRLNVWLQRSEGWVHVYTSSGEALGSCFVDKPESSEEPV